MSSPVQRATKLFVRTFGTTADACYQAPGRINLMGEHTDYNEGFVLPAAINFRVVIAAKRRDDKVFRAVTDIAPDEFIEWNFGDEGVQATGVCWANYLKCFTSALAQSGLEANGLDIAIVSDIPIESGFSSSSALEIAFGSALNDAHQLHLSPLAVAQIAQRGEYNYMGRTCGMKDQMISALAEQNQALLIDCLDLDYEAVAIPESLSLIIIHSGKYACEVQQKYQQRKHECQQVAEHLGLESLRHVKLNQLHEIEAELSTQLYRRAKHVITENRRTQNAARALEQCNIKKLSSLMAESHQSMRDDFEMSIPELDKLVDIVKACIGERGGVRLTGSGFGGSVVALVEHELTDDVVYAVESEYLKATGIEAQVYLCSAASAASRIDT
ncbi:galactokinase [Parashewanella spongiae]|uniref:Galactokinase n=1 Tax=Parashewanella spongiae TaxID=342950 RepID=A0A3A6TZH1_9GAMM|nr:galactokinase [Parashewanella spongiae]MCL1079720.1 galactokinase [Parashewanella spongiae]RJY07001.1 galactokinase [Parashewanella spongiae]